MEIMVEFQVITSTSTAPPATGNPTSGSPKTITPWGGSRIGISVGLTVGVIGGIGLILI